MEPLQSPLLRQWTRPCKGGCRRRPWQVHGLEQKPPPSPRRPKGSLTDSGMPCLQLDDVEGDEALYSHLLPKVMAPYDTRPGDTPRKVLIQRSAVGTPSALGHAAWRAQCMSCGLATSVSGGRLLV